MMTERLRLLTASTPKSPKRATPKLPKQKFLVAKLLDTVAQACSLLELELFRGLAHLGFEFGNIRVQLGLRIELRNACRLFLLDVAVFGLQNVRQPHLHLAD